MKLTFENGRSYVIKILEDAGHYFANYLMPEKVVNDLIVEVSFTNDLSSTCFTEDDVDKDPRIFYIEISNKMGTYNKIKSLAHEFVHVKQHAMNELFYLGNDKIEWKGQGIEKKHLCNMEYWDYPWELEAYGKEEGLTLRFCDDGEYKNRSWYKKRYAT